MKKQERLGSLKIEPGDLEALFELEAHSERATTEEGEVVSLGNERGLREASVPGGGAQRTNLHRTATDGDQARTAGPYPRSIRQLVSKESIRASQRAPQNQRRRPPSPTRAGPGEWKLISSKHLVVAFCAMVMIPSLSLTTRTAQGALLRMIS